MRPKKSWSRQNAQTIYNNAQHLGYPIFFFTVMTWQPAILCIWSTKTIFLDKKIVKNNYTIHEVDANISHAILSPKKCDSIIDLRQSIQ